MPRARGVLLCLVLAGLLAGCQSAQPADAGAGPAAAPQEAAETAVIPAPPPAPPSPAKSAPPAAKAAVHVQLLADRPPPPAWSGPGSELWPLQGQQHSCVIRKPGRTINTLCSMTPAPAGAGQPAGMFQWTVQGEGQSLLQLSPEGALVIRSATDEEEKVRVEYDPPMIVLPAHLEEGATLVGESRMTVWNLTDGKKRDHGKVKYRVSLLGSRWIKTAAGILPAQAVKTELDIFLALANARVVSQSYYQPQRGWLAEEVQETVRILGLFPSEKQRVLEMVP